MDYRSAYIRRSRKASRLKKRAATIGLLGVAACACVFALAMRETTPAAPAAQVAAQADVAAPAVLRTAARAETKKTRRVYPYSIVPGGVVDRQELARAVTDKVVATHYAAFEVARATVKTVAKPRAVYVSYRKGDKVYWTSKKLTLAKGETLLSDGRSEIRTRCGNRISDTPQLPVEAKGPSEEELDSSVEQVQADDGAAEGDVAQVGFAVDGNPAGHGYQLQTFATGGATPSGGGSTSRFNAVAPSFRGGNPIVTWDGGTPPMLLTSEVKNDPAGTSGSSAGGTPGTTDGTTGGTPGGTTDDTPPVDKTPSDGTQPTTDSGTKPSSPPGTLLPPTTDLPGKTNDPGKTPAKPTDVPEPGTLWLGGAGVAALLAARRAKKRPRG